MKYQNENYDFLTAKQKAKEKRKFLKNSIKTQKYGIIALVAIAGLIGIHLNVEDSGWLIFLAFIIFNTSY
jgi:hypothetical protein